MLFNHRDQNYANCYEFHRAIVRELAETPIAVQMAMGRSDWIGLATEIYAGKCSMPADSRTRSAIAMTLSLA
jgi:hypothetical protein